MSYRHPLPNHQSDGDLIAAVARGDLEGLGELFDRHAPDLRRYLARLGLPWGDVDDLVQSTMLEVVRAAPRFDARFSARTWIFGIATMLVRRHRRSLGRTAARIAAWAGLVSHQAEHTPAELCEKAEQTRRFENALAVLAPKKREAFVLVTLEGLSGDDVARALGVPVKTVWTRLHHARLELRSALKEDLR